MSLCSISYVDFEDNCAIFQIGVVWGLPLIMYGSRAVGGGSTIMHTNAYKGRRARGESIHDQMQVC